MHANNSAAGAMRTHVCRGFRSDSICPTGRPSMTDIAFAPARRLAAAIRQRKIGCAELLDHYLARVERFNPALNAIVATDIPAAKKRARAADRALAKGDIWGSFHGVPMTVKEAFDV